MPSLRFRRQHTRQSPRRANRVSPNRWEEIMAGRVVLLTGGAGGIGRVMTQALLADGHKVVAADRDPAVLERLKTLCQSSDRLHCVVAQLELEAGCRRAVEQTVGHFGKIEA